MTAPPVHPRTGMVLAAGYGTRLRPLTEGQPQPMQEVADKPVIDHVLDRFAAAGVADVIVNTHDGAGRVARHIAQRPGEPRVTVSREPELLGTGGAVLPVLGTLGRGPFYLANADTLWLNGPVPALARLAERWDDAVMDAVLLMVPGPAAIGVSGRGDFAMDPLGQVHRLEPAKFAPYYYGGVALASPRLFLDPPPSPFPLAQLFDRAIEAERLYGIAHDGPWFQIGSPASLAEVVAELTADSLRWVDP